MRPTRVLGARPSPARFLRVAVGAVGIGTGAAMMITASIGVTPWDVLLTAIAGRSELTVGMAGIVVSLAMFAVCAPFGRWPSWGNLVLAVLASLTVDGVIRALDTPGSLAGQIGMFTIGSVVLCIAVGLVVVADIGVGPLEMVMLVATDRGARLVPTRVVIEGTMLAVGWSLGGALGVGTAVFAVISGPLIALSLKVQGHELRPLALR